MTRVDLGRWAIQLRVAGLARALRFALCAGALTFASAGGAFALIAHARAQTPVSEPTKAEAVPAVTPAPPAPQATVPPGTPPNATVMRKSDVQGVLGKDVRSAANEEMGHIIDVIVDASGEPRAAVIDFGGFLGVGSRKIAVDWNALHFTPGDSPSPIILDLTKDQVKAAPEYADKKPVVILGAAGVTHPLPQDEPAKSE